MKYARRNRGRIKKKKIAGKTFDAFWLRSHYDEYDATIDRDNDDGACLAHY